MQPDILIVDDDQDITVLIHTTIHHLCATIDIASTGQDALMMVKKKQYHILILDIGLPDIEGFSICSWVRKHNKITQPIIIMLTARDSSKDKILGFDLGADEYISKPFSPAFLVRRIEVLWKQYNIPQTATPHVAPTMIDTQSYPKHITYKTLHIDLQQKKIFHNNTEIVLTYTEWCLLVLLVRTPGTVFTRREIIDHIHGNKYLIFERAIDVHIASLRRKIHPYKSCIKTKRNMGYYLQIET